MWTAFVKTTTDILVAKSSVVDCRFLNKLTLTYKLILCFFVPVLLSPRHPPHLIFPFSRYLPYPSSFILVLFPQFPFLCLSLKCGVPRSSGFYFCLSLNDLLFTVMTSWPICLSVTLRSIKIKHTYVLVYHVSSGIERIFHIYGFSLNPEP